MGINHSKNYQLNYNSEDHHIKSLAFLCSEKLRQIDMTDFKNCTNKFLSADVIQKYNIINDICSLYDSKNYIDDEYVSVKIENITLIDIIMTFNYNPFYPVRDFDNRLLDIFTYTYSKKTNYVGTIEAVQPYGSLKTIHFVSFLEGPFSYEI